MDKALLKGFALLLLGFDYGHTIALQDQLDSVILIDDRDPKEQNKTKAVIGCNNELKIKELSCSKERGKESNTTVKQPFVTTKVKTRKEASQEKELQLIRTQLSAIMAKLSELTADTEKTSPEVQKQIETISAIQQEINKESNTTKLPKKIKVIATNSDHDIVEVQSGESLSKYAQKYYGNPRKYHNIHRANPDKIDDSLQIYVGDRLIIPTSEKYPYKVIETPKKVVEANVTQKVEEKIVNETNTSIITPRNDTPMDDPNKAVYVDQKLEVKQNEILLEPKQTPIITKSIPKENNLTVVQMQESNLSWIETKVPKGFDIYQLAERYYGDKKAYHHIYNANPKIIGNDLKLTEGMKVKIPITKQFHEQPEFLNIQ